MNRRQGGRVNVRLLFGVFGAVLVLYGVAICLVFAAGALGGYSIEKIGQFGDALGSVNALFAGLSFAAVAVTLYFQQRELEEAVSHFKRQRFYDTEPVFRYPLRMSKFERLLSRGETRPRQDTLKYIEFDGGAEPVITNLGALVLNCIVVVIDQHGKVVLRREFPGWDNGNQLLLINGGRLEDLDHCLVEIAYVTRDYEEREQKFRIMHSGCVMERLKDQP